MTKLCCAIVCFTIAFNSLYLSAQQTQTIKGQVTDLNTGNPLVGANIIILDNTKTIGAISNENGYFSIENIPVGRQGIKVSFIGYNQSVINNLYVYSGKETVVNVQLEEKVYQGADIVVKANNRKDQTLNEMVLVSGRSFTVEETEKYAGSIGDPARMAGSFAGVLTLGTQINDIVIRGNSPNGMLWRLNGLQIPNPNHFGDISSSGGTSSMLNNNVLANSDFITGTFPAEYGNATSGVFDLKLRKGNSDKTEYLVQFGTTGLEFGIEGPIKSKKNQASFIVNYRYATLGLVKLFGFNFGVFAIPSYQDLSFNFELPTNKLGKFSVFGLMGNNWLGSEVIDEEQNSRDITQVKNNMFFGGVSHLYFFNENSNITTSIGYGNSQNNLVYDVVDEGVVDDYVWNENNSRNLEVKLDYKNRLNSQNFVKIGAGYSLSSLNMRDSLWADPLSTYIHTIDVKGSTPLLNAYVQWKHRANESLSIVSGVYTQYLTMNKEQTIEPRLSMKWDISQRQSISFGSGLHSKMQPIFIYHYQLLNDSTKMSYQKPNSSLKMTKSANAVFGYNYLINENSRIKVETYYQYLFDVPVDVESSHRSLLNYGSSFGSYEYTNLTNKGTAYNYGVELTIEKFLSANFYYLFTLSVFDSKYKGSDDILRNSRFNTNVITNLVGGYEWDVKGDNTFAIDSKIMWAGGERKIPLNYESSAAKGYAVYDLQNAYNERFMNYFKFDLRFSYKINKQNKKSSHTLALDLINLTNRYNHFLSEYDDEINDYKEMSNLGIMPGILWRWNF